MKLTKCLRPFLMGVFALLLVISAQAQSRTVSGKVTDASGNPLPGASVVVKGTRTGTTTDGEGNFSFNVPQSASELTISAVGFDAQTVAISGSSISVTLAQSLSQLTDVVVVGYGTRKVKDATGAVVSLGEKSFNKGVISTPEQLLQGRTAGVTVTTTSGEPGSGVNINIRGTASIRSNNNPLFVVDGVPLDGGGTTAGGIFTDGGSSARNPLAFLNPNDIENISILKDASAAASYGSRGANGVVIITTKSGRGKGGFQFSANASVSKTANRYDLLNAQDFIYGVREAVKASGADPAGTAFLDQGASTDWQDQIFRTAISQNYNLSWGMSKGGTSVRLSGSYDDQEGIVKNSDLNRKTIRANLTQKFGSKLRFDITGTYSNVKNNYAPISNNAGFQGSLIGAALTFNPTYPIFNADGTYFDPGDGNRNPVQMLNYFQDKDDINRFLTNVSGSYEILKGLTYKATFGYDNSKSERFGYADPRLGTGAYGGNTEIRRVNFGNPIFGNGRANGQYLDLKSTVIEHTLNYVKDFKGEQTLEVLGGYSYQETVSEFRQQVRWGVNGAQQLVDDFSKYQNSTPFFGDTTKYEIQSYFGRANYSIKDKYFFTATVRVDGSSKFSEGNKYGTFPAFAAKWKMANEDFFANSIGKVFSDFSLRLNYGITGNQEFPAYASLAIVQTNFDGSQNVVTNSNPNLRWEETTTYGAGLDYELFAGRVRGSVDYFNKATKDLLFLASYPQPAASADRWVNLPGIVRNTGWEFGVDVQAVKGSKFSWDVNYNMTFLKNEIEDFGQNVVNTGEVSGQGLSGAYAQTFTNGYPLFTFKMPVFLRYNGEGNAVYANGSQDQLLGSALPKFTAGLTNNFRYGNWNASVFVNAVRGFYVYNNTANALFLKGSLKNGRNVTYDVFNSIENPINPGSVSTRFLEKGDFVRIANATLGYTFDIKNSKAIKTLNIALSGQNLGLITNYSGLDPEINTDKTRNGVPSRGFDYTAYPRARTFTLGVNVGF